MPTLEDILHSCSIREDYYSNESLITKAYQISLAIEADKISEMLEDYAESFEHYTTKDTYVMLIIHLHREANKREFYIQEKLDANNE